MRNLKLMMGVFLAFVCTGTGFAKENQIEKANNVLNEIMKTPDKAIPSDLFEKPYALASCLPKSRALSWWEVLSDAGVLVCRRHGDGPWGAPSLFSLGQGSFGFQIGGEATDVVFIVMNAAGARKLVQDEVKLGADASVAAGPVGRTAEGATDGRNFTPRF